ncbi:MAG: NAD-binding protein, partial [Planctomycetota bacterium]
EVEVLVDELWFEPPVVLFDTPAGGDSWDRLETWTDSIYYTFVTYSTLGYGDILPTTPDARLFVVSMIVVGLGSFITAVTMLIGPMIEQRMKGVLSIMGRFQRAKDHVIVCGYSSVGESVVDELQDRGAPYVIIEDREDLAAHLRSKGHDVLSGDAARQETLQEANAGAARAVVAAFDSDSVNTLVALTAKELRDATKGARFRIVARVEDEENIDKVRRVGADEVISPSTLGGRAMARKAVGAETAS